MTPRVELTFPIEQKKGQWVDRHTFTSKGLTFRMEIGALQQYPNLTRHDVNRGIRDRTLRIIDDVPHPHPIGGFAGKNPTLIRDDDLRALSGRKCQQPEQTPAGLSSLEAANAIGVDVGTLADLEVREFNGKNLLNPTPIHSRFKTIWRRFNPQEVETVKLLKEQHDALRRTGWFGEIGKRRFSIAGAAKEFGLPYYFLERAVEAGKLPVEQRPSFHIQVEEQPSFQRGKSTTIETMAEKDVVELAALVRLRLKEGEKLKPGQWDIFSGLCKRVGFKGARGDVLELLNCWEANGQLQSKMKLEKREGKITNCKTGRVRTVDKLWEFKVYNVAQFMALWNRDLSDVVKELHKLVAIGKRIEVRTVKEAMAKDGIFGIQLTAALKQAGIEYRPHVAGKSVSVYERTGSSPDKRRQLLTKILKLGPVRSSDKHTLAEKTGIAINSLSSELAAIGAEKTRIGLGGPWCWYVGERPTNIEECQRLGTDNTKNGAPSHSTGINGGKPRRGPRRSERTWKVYRRCYEMMAEGMERRTIMRKLREEFPDPAYTASLPKEESTVTSYASKWAKDPENNLPWPLNAKRA